MSNDKNTPAEPVADLPKGFPPELIPLYDWWKKEGLSWLVAFAVAGAAVGAFYGVKGWIRGRDRAAAAALAEAATSGDLEVAVAKNGSAKSGDLIRLRLAKAYYDEGRYQDALDIYDKLVGRAPDGFADLAPVGRAFALEGLKKYGEAGKAFADFAADPANAKNYLRFAAQLGAARCKAQAGDKDGAVKDLEALKAGFGEDAPETARIDALVDAVRRWTPRAARTPLDAAADAAKALEAQPAAEAKPAESAQPAAEEKPAAEAKPAEEKPAEEKK